MRQVLPTVWPSGLRHCLQAPVWRAWVRTPQPSLDVKLWNCDCGNGGFRWFEASIYFLDINPQRLCELMRLILNVWKITVREMYGKCILNPGQRNEARTKKRNEVWRNEARTKKKQKQKQSFRYRCHKLCLLCLLCLSACAPLGRHLLNNSVKHRLFSPAPYWR